ncbi:T9SS type A sorting domain-containing protein [Spirosoma aerolatum]|uniref:T9SS type A sorting domain-containing protein n=1 Tax=Spirosoma aerolatum TaxID=1211326 RepID=UPI001475211C|nr:T9SS type A sorting domain-containing protein [Spirosoma aerolatum]
MATSGSGSINATGWTGSAQDANDYYEFTLTPNSGYQLDITGITLSARRSAAGPANYLLSYSIAGSETTITTGTLSVTTSTSISPTFSLKTPQAVRFRIYAWGASIPAGTFRLDNTLTVNASAPLPVELVSFSGQPTDKAIELKWATSWEDRNEGFDILRGVMPDGLEKIGFVEGHTTSQAVSAYSYIDRDVKAGLVYYYRLRQRDIGGGSELSKIIAIRADFEGEALGASVYPNPNHGSFTVTTSSLETSTISLHDALGTVIPVTIRKNGQPTSASVNAVGYVTPGVYFLRFQMSEGTTRQIIKVIIE